MAFSGTQITRLGVSGFPRQRYGSFAGKLAGVAAVTGGYTPYSVYDPGQEKRIRDRRRKLRREREQLRADLKRLVSGEPEKAQDTPRGAKGRSAAVTAPTGAPVAARKSRGDRATTNAAVLQAASISARQARLEAIKNELLLLNAEFRVLQARETAEVRRQAKENELLIILLLAS